MPPLSGLLALRRGRSPNCSSAGSVVGAALVSAVGAAVVLNAWADRFLRWRDRDPSQGPPGSDDAGPEPDTPTPDEPAPRLRREAFGGILAWPNPGALLYLNARAAADARAAGAVEIGGGPDIEGALSAPTEAHLALTGRCPVACSGCYLDAGPEGDEPDLAPLYGALEQLAEMGVFEVAFGGGEALLRRETLELARAARRLGLVPNLTTSGFGVTPALAAEMAGLFGQINVSLDGLGDVYAAARGWDGAALGLRAIRALRAAGARVGVNTVLTRPLLETPGALEALGEAIRDAGAVEWQWLRLKPAGRGADAWSDLAPTAEQNLALWPRALAAEARLGLAMRFDCALAPFLVAHDLEPARLAQLGVTGCPGGESLWARGPAGEWAPCSFVAGADGDAELPARWRSDGQLRAWRSRAAAPPAPCSTCDYRAICRGGCRVHAAHLAGDATAPDPECPRVIAWASTQPAGAAP